MANHDLKESKPMASIRRIALRYPEVEEGASCVNRAFKARNKSFLFMGMNQETYNLRLKLSESLPEAEKLAKQSPECFSVGLHGWIHVTLSHTKSLNKSQIERWVDESFRLLAPKKLVAEMTSEKSGTKKRATKKQSTKKQAAKKRSR